MNVTGRAGPASGQKVTYADVSREALARSGEDGPDSSLGPVTPKRTCPVMKNHLWMLIGNDLMLGYCRERRVWSLGDGTSARTSRAGTDASGPVSCASGHHLSAGAGESDHWDHAVENQRKEHMAQIHRPDAGVLRPVDLTYASGRPMEAEQCEPNGSIWLGALFKPHGRLKLTLLDICIDIATL